jgi:hypothetical protein
LAAYSSFCVYRCISLYYLIGMCTHHAVVGGKGLVRGLVQVLLQVVCGVVMQLGWDTELVVVKW